MSAGAVGPDEVRPADALVDQLRGHDMAGRRAFDLRGVDLADADLSNLDLSGLDLTGANLRAANLSGAHLVGSVLHGATLYAADLAGAELLGADLGESDLSNAHAEGAGFGGADLAGACLREARLDGATFTQAKLSHASLRCATLRNARMLEVDFSYADLQRSDLRSADLSDSRLEGAVLSHADLRGARLSNVSGFEKAHWIGVDLRDMDLRGAVRVRRFVLDENYLHEFRTSSRGSALLHSVWSITSDCGRSFARWGLWVALVVLSFAALFGLVDVDYGPHPTPLSPVYFSIVTLTTLGYGDALPASLAAQIVVMLEVVLGYLALGGLISIFANKMARRAE